jgi:hypothetical protein
MHGSAKIIRLGLVQHRESIGICGSVDVVRPARVGHAWFGMNGFSLKGIGAYGSAM